MNQETRSRAARRARTRRIGLAVALATAVAGCGGGGETVADDGRSALTAAPTAPPPKYGASRDAAAEAIREAARLYTRAAPAKNAPTREAVAGITAFAAELYRIAAEPGENVVFSPLSIAYAFAMARAGARGETAAQFDEAFGFPAGRDKAFNALTNGLASSSAPPTPKPSTPKPSTSKPSTSKEIPPPEKPILTLANALFVQRDHPLMRSFLRALTEQYGSEVRAFDLARPDEAVGEVNAWASRHTAGRIPRILERLDPLTRLVIANAVYLKADWTVPFEAAGEQAFAVGGEDVTVPMMDRTATFGYVRGDGWHAVEVPYFGGRLAMRVLLPTGSTTPADLLEPGVLAAAGRSRPAAVHLTMPTWDFGSDFDLTRLLPKLGITDAFGMAADFSGISDEQLLIDQAVHEANITVDELGTVAAAVTAVSIRATSAGAGPPPTEFKVDRPFAFEIVDLKTGAPLFLGSVADPRAK